MFINFQNSKLENDQLLNLRGGGIGGPDHNDDSQGASAGDIPGPTGSPPVGDEQQQAL